jgi:hypothetical protein
MVFKLSVTFWFYTVLQRYCKKASSWHVPVVSNPLKRNVSEFINKPHATLGEFLRVLVTLIIIHISQRGGQDTLIICKNVLNTL